LETRLGVAAQLLPEGNGIFDGEIGGQIISKYDTQQSRNIGKLADQTRDI
jgi:hypothetical protein